VTVRLIGVQGATVRTLADGELPAGPHSIVWDGTDDRGRRTPSGVYFLNVAAPGGAATRRIVVLR
jgi:flagellar hook assembly protein FlgD